MTATPRPSHPTPRPALATALLLAACAPGGGGDTTPNLGDDLPPELVFARYHVTQSRSSELALRTAQNLGTARVPERSGRELFVRVHPDGDRVVFARERDPGDARSRELYTAGLDSALPEVRLTANTDADDHPCWSPDGELVLFSTTREGDRRLWLTDAEGVAAQQFLAADPGVQDRDPDWSPATDRVVFSRLQGGVRRLWLVQGNGTGLVPLTSGAAATGDDQGDRFPAFSPDGGAVVFARLTGPDQGSLWTVDTATGAEQQLFAPRGSGGTVALPRYSPAGDRIFFGLAEPGEGRQGLRLTAVADDGADPLLVEPGEQWTVGGVDFLPAMAPAPQRLPVETVPVDEAQIQLSSGVQVRGGPAQLRAVDGDELILATVPFDNHEIASINCRFTLPVPPTEVAALYVSITARVTRSDGDSTLRTSFYNPVDERFDTVAELPDPGTGPRELAFATQSLKHVSRERQVRVTAIGELSAGAVAELAIDQVELRLVRRPEPAPQ